jgi:hypothetical protein
VSRILGILGSFLACSALLTWGAAACFGPQALERGVKLYGYRWYVDRILAKAPDEKRPLVVWLGDSTIMDSSRPSYPQLLEPWLHRKGVDSRVLAGPAFDPYVFYFLAGRVIERLDPAAVVIVARFASFHPRGSWKEFRYNDMSSFLLPSLLPRTFLLPLAPRQLSPARLLLAQTLNDETAEQIFYGAEGLRRLYADAPFWEPLGPPKPPPVLRPAMRDVLDAHDLEVSRRQPAVAMLEATVRVVTEAGGVPLVIGSPIPYEALRERPDYDAAAIQRRFDTLRAIVEESGGMFLDLHELLPQSELADYAGHFTSAGALRLSHSIFPFVREALRRADGWPPSWTPRRTEG